MKVLIVGAGPTGLTTALELARQGIVPEIVDAKDEPSWKSRAVVVLPRSIEILDRTGVGERLISEGIRMKKVHIYRGQKQLIDITLPSDEITIIGIAQDRTESLMIEQLEHMGVSVRFGTKVDLVTTSDTSAEVTFESGEKKTYDWVVGADGVGSAVRSSLKIPYEGYELEEEWSIADVELTAEHEYDSLNAWLLKGEHKERDGMVMVPIERNRVRLISSTPDSLETSPVTLDVKKVRRTGTFKITVRQAQEYVRGRVVLAGDAAHAHSPIGGRGMNLGIEDGQALASALIHNTVQEYARERKQKATRTIRITEHIRTFIASNNPFVVMGIYIVTWCIQNIGFVQKKFIKNVSSL
ncbi:MAG: FAD-dependent oxidoreductase [Patescibacteria group bacterium UBA2163]